MSQPQRIQVYEGPLPIAVARDFEFAKVYTSLVNGLGERRSDSVKEPNGAGGYRIVKSQFNLAHDDSRSNWLFEQTLDLAIAKIIEQAEQEIETNGVELIADVRVIRRNPYLLKDYPKGALDLRVEAIGYRKRNPSNSPK